MATTQAVSTTKADEQAEGGSFHVASAMEQEKVLEAIRVRPATEQENEVGKKEDDDLEKEVKEALKKDKEAKPAKDAGKSAIVKRAFEAKHGKGSQN